MFSLRNKKDFSDEKSALSVAMVTGVWQIFLEAPQRVLYPICFKYVLSRDL